MVFQGLFSSSSSSGSIFRAHSPRKSKTAIAKQPSLPSLFRPPGPSATPSSSSLVAAAVTAAVAVGMSPGLSEPGAESTSPPLPADLILDESQLAPIPEPAPDLRDLNNCLEALAEIFTDIQVEVFREMLGHFDGESRLEVVTDALLKNRTTWVKGRWRVAGTAAVAGAAAGSKASEDGHAGEDGRAAGMGVQPNEAFRSPEYKDAVKALFRQEFRGLSRSTINAVLAEVNYSYLDARPTLVSIASKSWRVTLSSLFVRRRTPPYPSPTGPSPSVPDPESHPLVTRRPAGQGNTAVPALRSTGCPELDRELYAVLILPMRQRAAAVRMAEDHSLALRLNEEQAETEGMVYECSCCYGDAAFEQITACSAEGHLVCFDCVQRSVTEAVFGQGWQSSIDAERGTLRCLSVEADRCHGHVPPALLHRAMMEDGRGPEILHKLESRLAEHSLLDSGLPLVRCPFCDYVEIDEVYDPHAHARHRLRSSSVYTLILLALSLGIVPVLLPALLLASFVGLLASSRSTLGDRLTAEWRRAVARRRRRAVGPKFACRAPACGRLSCMSCGKAWVDVHVCNESSLVALRTQVEQAMSLAVKRVCPRCSTSFVKTEGCNKLTCPCGYKMCYVCRADLSTEGYRHFCDHFRPEGDARPCRECDRCNLWENEDTDQVLHQAREDAERLWRETEKRDLSARDKAFLETGVASRGGGHGVGTALRCARWPSLAEVLDAVVECLYV